MQVSHHKKTAYLVPGKSSFPPPLHLQPQPRPVLPYCLCFNHSFKQSEHMILSLFVYTLLLYSSTIYFLLFLRLFSNFLFFIPSLILLIQLSCLLFVFCFIHSILFASAFVCLSCLYYLFFFFSPFRHCHFLPQFFSSLHIFCLFLIICFPQQFNYFFTCSISFSSIFLSASLSFCVLVFFRCISLNIRLGVAVFLTTWLRCSEDKRIIALRRVSEDH